MKEDKTKEGIERQYDGIGISCVWDEKQSKAVQRSEKQYETV